MMKAALTAILAFAGAASAQIGGAPIPKFDAVAGEPMGEGNAVTISPDDAVLYVTRSDGVLDGLNPADGDTLFSIDPTTAGASGSLFTCKSGVSIYGGDDTTGAGAYVAYAVNSDEGSTFVIAVSHPDGAPLWATEIAGSSEGTPQVGTGGTFVYVTHNPAGVGSFTILDNTGAPFFTESGGNFTYGGLGMYRNPAYGNYRGGFDDTPNDGVDQNNRNDILVWSATSVPFTPAAGQLYGFQLPLNFTDGDDSSTLEVLEFSNVGWQSTNPPGFANEGTEMYWGISRNEFRGWTQVNGKTARFQGGATTNSGGRWGRGDPRFADPPATPVVNTNRTHLFCGMASLFFVALNPLDASETMPSIWETTTTSLVTTNAVLWPVDESAVIWFESLGIAHATNVVDGVDFWAVPVPGGAQMLSEFSISPDGSTLYYGTNTGDIHGWIITGGPPGPVPPPSTTSPPTFTEAPVTSVPETGIPTMVEGPPPSTPSPPPMEPPSAPSAPTTEPPTFTSGACQPLSAVFSVLAAVAVALFMN